MNHFYAFGSVCRGEVDGFSDIDLLACVSEPASKVDPQKFSVYSHERLKELWVEGNPFSWHLHLESRLLFASDGIDFIAQLGTPNRYKNALKDCEKFSNLCEESYRSLDSSSHSNVFHLSCMFLAIRNIATCFSLAEGRPVFSRNSPLLVKPPLNISKKNFDILVRSRILSTRGAGQKIADDEIDEIKKDYSTVREWVHCLLNELRKI
jgi:hypothetical protein